MTLMNGVTRSYPDDSPLLRLSRPPFRPSGGMLPAAWLALLAALDGITHRHGGRVYLAKDAGSTPARMREGYPRHSAFAAVRTEVAGPTPKFVSALSQRLAL